MKRIILALAIVAGVALGANEVPAALSGRITSQAEGVMEGVIMGAKRAESTMNVWVVSDAQGQYAFPRERLQPGKYGISVRAAGYELPRTSIEITAQPARLDLQLNPVTRPLKLARQLSNGEWLMSVPGTEQQKRTLGNCVTCHTLERVLFSRFGPDEMTEVVERMSRHTNNSSPIHPWFRPEPRPAEQSLSVPAQATPFAKYLSSINLSAVDTFEFGLKTLLRPRGKATQVIYTMYDLPRPDASPHDEVLDAQGNVWYSDFNSQFLGKLDPKTGKVVEYKVPQNRYGQIAQGGLQIDIDREGRVYYGNMSQMGDAHLTMIDPAFQHVDGKIWTNIVFDSGEAGGTWHVDLNTNTWAKVAYPPGSPSARAYDIVADSKNNMYGMHMNNDKLWMTDAKTLKTVWYDFPTRGGGCRRGHIDSEDRLWCGGFNRDSIAMFDPKTQKISEWKVPAQWTRPYDAQFDDKSYVWAAGMDTDIAVRLNPQTGEFTEYLLPHETNVRNVTVQKSGALSSLWLGDQHGGTIVRVEPQAP
jgi:virginiamycin B lyase